jgi:WD40 repeat protein
MIKRSSSGGESSFSGARKRQATSSAPSAPFGEDPLGPSSSQKHDASSVPSIIPINLIAVLILPYVKDRSTWNSVCCANKELREAGKKMRPPWPNSTLSVGGTDAVWAVAFSPCKSFLACSIDEESVIHVWNRHGEQTRLEGHTDGITCLQYSLDGRYLASGSFDESIRLWRISSESAARSSPSEESRNRASDITLLGHRTGTYALDFSPTDSNLLASGSMHGEIKLWDVINQVCIHSFHPQPSIISTIFFLPGDDIRCYGVTSRCRMIRIVRNKRMEFISTILEEPYSLGRCPLAAFSPCGTCFASMSYMGVGTNWELAMFDLSTMAKTQSVSLTGYGRLPGIAMSPDGKKLAIVNRSGGIRIFECHDLTIQNYVNTMDLRPDEAKGTGFCPVAFDPTSRVYAVGCLDGRVELRTI